MPPPSSKHFLVLTSSFLNVPYGAAVVYLVGKMMDHDYLVQLQFNGI